jgi:hypothetical protein
MSTDPIVDALHDPKSVDLYIDKLPCHEGELMLLSGLNLVEFSAKLQVGSLITHYNSMIDTGKIILPSSCVYLYGHDQKERWKEWILSDPLTFRAPKRCDSLMILFEKHRNMMACERRRATKAKPSKASPLTYRPLPPHLQFFVLLRDKDRLRRVSRLQYNLAGVCTLLCIAAVLTDGVSDGYPTPNTLLHFFCLGALYVTLHIALTQGAHQQDQLELLKESHTVKTFVDPLMMYLPLCMAICPHLCSSVLYFDRSVDTKPPVDDMILTVFGLWISYAWYYNQIVVPQRRGIWVFVLALKSMLWACEYIASGEISVSSSSLQYQLVRLGFPHGNTPYLLSGVARYCIASRFMMHKGVHRWSGYTSIVVCLFLLTYPHFIHPDLTVSHTHALHTYAKHPRQQHAHAKEPRQQHAHAKEPRQQHALGKYRNTTTLNSKISTFTGEKKPHLQHASREYCDITAVDGVLSTFMGEAYAVSRVPCILKEPEQCRCAGTAVCESILFRRDNYNCIRIYLSAEEHISMFSYGVSQR